MPIPLNERHILTGQLLVNEIFYAYEISVRACRFEQQTFEDPSLLYWLAIMVIGPTHRAIFHLMRSQHMDRVTFCGTGFFLLSNGHPARKHAECNYNRAIIF